jgi:hypothetical protein
MTLFCDVCPNNVSRYSRYLANVYSVPNVEVLRNDIQFFGRLGMLEAIVLLARMRVLEGRRQVNKSLYC